MIDKLRDCFDEMVVYKDLRKSNFFSALGLPSFLRDWLLKKFADEEGNLDDHVHTEINSWGTKYFCQLEQLLEGK